ncbi:MAG: electron transfer flavoprotein subunit alpha/FixB family protein [Acidobacteria bacterium]|nr:electron transfer flavoprotein subunit alpha/FixB family protein [Acidobacteriota bacterium]
MVIVIVESHDGRLNSASLEAIVAARLLGQPITVVVPGHDTRASAEALRQVPIDDVVRLEHPRLDVYTPDATVAALTSLFGTMAPTHIFCAHTYQARDYMPRLAARLNRPLLTECTAIAVTGDAVTCSRPIFQGKIVADVVLEGPAPHFICVQIGAFRSDALGTRETPVPVRVVAATLDAAAVQQTVEPPFRESKQDVDLTVAPRIVAAGRGIREEGHLAIVKQLASALGAEVAASRPLCDAGWLPMDRQIGSSGQTVAPQLYLALGISGAIQHIVGMKGSRTIVAINKDADAPIFEIADYGIVGDLFEVVPALITALEAR